MITRMKVAPGGQCDFCGAGLEGPDVTVFHSRPGHYAGMVAGRLVHTHDDGLWAACLECEPHVRDAGPEARMALAQMALEVHRRECPAEHGTADLEMFYDLHGLYFHQAGNPAHN